MTKKEILNRNIEKDRFPDGTEVNFYSPEGIEKSMDEYAKQEAIEFFKWYCNKMLGFMEYLTSIRPFVKSEEIEANLIKFEGQTFDNLYNMYNECKEENKD